VWEARHPGRRIPWKLEDEPPTASFEQLGAEFGHRGEAARQWHETAKRKLAAAARANTYRPADPFLWVPTTRHRTVNVTAKRVYAYQCGFGLEPPVSLSPDYEVIRVDQLRRALSESVDDSDHPDWSIYRRATRRAFKVDQLFSLNKLICPPGELLSPVFTKAMAQTQILVSATYLPQFRKDPKTGLVKYVGEVGYPVRVYERRICLPLYLHLRPGLWDIKVDDPVVIAIWKASGAGTPTSIAAASEKWWKRHRSARWGGDDHSDALAVAEEVAKDIGEGWRSAFETGYSEKTTDAVNYRALHYEAQVSLDNPQVAGFDKDGEVSSPVPEEDGYRLYLGGAVKVKKGPKGWFFVDGKWRHGKVRWVKRPTPGWELADDDGHKYRGPTIKGTKRAIPQKNAFTYGGLLFLLAATRKEKVDRGRMARSRYGGGVVLDFHKETKTYSQHYPLGLHPSRKHCLLRKVYVPRRSARDAWYAATEQGRVFNARPERGLLLRVKTGHPTERGPDGAARFLNYEYPVPPQDHKDQARGGFWIMTANGWRRWSGPHNAEVARMAA
jgi:hypothetical protein